MYKVLFLTLFCSYALASSESVSILKPRQEQSDIVQTHHYISSQIVGFAEYIDSFFGQYTRTDKSNKTRLILINDTKLDEKGPLTSKFAVKARLNLPHLEELLKVKIKKQDRTEVNKPKKESSIINNSENTSNINEDNYYFIDRKLTTQVGIDVSTKPDISVRSELKLEIGDENDILRGVNGLFWSGRGGLGDQVAIEYDRLVSDRLLFRFLNRATWNEKTSEVDYTHGPELFYSINDGANLSFDIKMDGSKTNSSLWTIVGYSSSLVYSIRPFYDWILFKTGPVLSYPQEADFASNLSYFVQVQVFIGAF